MRALLRWPAFLCMGFIYWLSSLEPGEIPGTPVPHLDKVVHALLYALLLLCFHPPPKARCEPVKWLPYAVAASLVYAVCDELHQSWVPGRTPEILDLLADAAGVGGAAGLARTRWLRRLAYRILA